MKKTIVLVVSVMLILLFPLNVMAYDWGVVFGTAGYFDHQTMRTPLRPTGNVYANLFSTVTSAYNQPRYISGKAVGTYTNPHNGVDISAAYGTPVYPVDDGWFYKTTSSTIVFRIDVDNNGVLDPNIDKLFVEYKHMSQIHSTGAYVNKNTHIGHSGGNPAHLHFGYQRNSYADTDLEWVENEPYYRGYSGWDYGKQLDLGKYAYMDVGHVATAVIYGMNCGTKIVLDPGEVVLFHRKSGTSAWSSNTMTRSNDWWSYNLLNRYSGGTKVDWMIRVIRNEIPSGYYDTAFYPAKFYQPDPNPNTTAYKYDYFVNVLN